MMRLRDNSLLRGKNLALIIFVAISIFALSYNPVRTALSQVLYIVAPSIWKTRAVALESGDTFLTNFKIKRSLVYENIILREEVARMQVQVLDRNLLSEKVLKLEDALGRAGSDNRVSAEVLSSPRWSPYDILGIDAGSDHGIALGDLVVYANAGVIGVVAEVYPTSAKVKLYSSPGEENIVFIGPKSTPSSAHGRGMGNFEAKLPKGSVVEKGDIVVLPKGNLILGTVGLVEEEPALPFVNVFFRTPFNIADIHEVEVIIKK